ncbi:MAG: sterol desaturase family protein [Candidatus Eremiobacterota bacterium]
MSHALEFLIWFCASLLLGSFLEWCIHRYFMHTTRILPVAVERHGIKHHAERRAPGKFLAKADELKEYHLFETSAMPLVWLAHFPLFGLVYLAFGPWASTGMAAGMAAYMLAYEMLHWYIHCPDRFWFRNTAWFRFLSEHHRRHHHKARINYNVVCPLADLVLGTFSLEPVVPEPEQLPPSARASSAGVR